MKKIFTLAFSLAAVFLLADVYFGDKAAVTSLHSTTNFLVAILGSSSNAPVRLINPSNLLASASNAVTVAAGTSISVTTNGAGGVMTYTIAAAGGSIAASNTVWLSQNGNDATGVRGDFGHAFLTPTGAVNAARAFDTIMVLPGTYGVKTVLFDVSTLLLRTNINWHFFSGAKITNDSASVYAIFDDSQNSFPAGVGKVYITGDGEFVDDYSGSVVRVGIAGSSVDMTFRKMSDHVNVSAGILTLHNGTIEGSTSSDKACLTVQNASSTSVLDHVYLHYTNSVATGRTIYIKNANTNTILRDCVLDAGPTATNSVLAVTTGTITVQGLVTMTVTNNPNVTFNPLIYQPPLIQATTFASGAAFDNIILTNALNRIITRVASTVTTQQIDVVAGPSVYYWPLVNSNIVCQFTNMWTSQVSNRLIDFTFAGGAADKTVTFLCPNPAGVIFHWGPFIPTNGATSFTVTNGHTTSASFSTLDTNFVESFYSPGI